MAREFTGPLTRDDLVWLGARYPKSRVQRMVAVHGLEKAGEAPKGADPVKGEARPAASVESPEEDVEDLIGNTDSDFDPQDHTEAEIAKHLKANPGDRMKVLALEAEGRGRKGVLAL